MPPSCDSGRRRRHLGPVGPISRLLLCSFFCAISVQSARLIKPEYLRKGGKKYYLNSCPCGMIGVKEQDITSEAAQEQSKRVEQLLLQKYGRTKRSVGAGDESRETNNQARKSPRRRRGKEAVQYGQEEGYDVQYKALPDAPANETISDDERVIGGVIANPGQVPWYVLLENSVNGEICGGAVINRLFILTAAHCTESFRKHQTSAKKFPRNVHIFVRQPLRCSRARFSSRHLLGAVAAVYDHPKYNKLSSNQLVYDFALIKMRRPILPVDERLRPVCLPPTALWKRSFSGQYSMISGYGRTTKKFGPTGQTSCVLRLGEVRVKSPNERSCKRVSSHSYAQMCGQGDRPVDACSGDSGGPLTHVDDQFKNRILVGVVSYGQATCASKWDSGVYGRVTSVMKWLLTKIQSGECAHYY